MSLNDQVTVRIDPATEDPVTVEVEAGYATHGRYTVDLRLATGWRSIGRGDVADDIPDRYLLPADPQDLTDPGTRLLILGNYAPAYAPTGKQILVHYVFSQGGREVHRTEIEQDNVDILRCNHTFRFEPGE